RDRLVRQVEPMRAPVLRVGAPLDHPRRVQLVDQPGEGDRRDVERLGKLALLRAFTALQARQHGPLRSGGVELARAKVRIGSEQPRHVVEGKSDLPSLRNDPIVSYRHHKQAYNEPTAIFKTRPEEKTLADRFAPADSETERKFD